MKKFRHFLGKMADGESSMKAYDGPSFDLLPDEMIVHMLSFADADVLLLCRLVSARWRQLVDDFAFREKASRENHQRANGGRGYCSFSQIDPDVVKKLDLPWFVFYVICKHDPFGRNLVKNHCGQDEYKHWTITNDHNWWTIEPTPQGAPELPDVPDFEGYTSCFVSTHRLCSKKQKIVFKNYGLTDNVMKFLQPDISISEWYSGRFDCGCKYALRATIHDSNDKLLEQHNYNDELPQWEANKWTKVSHTFKNQNNTSHLILYHSGVDTQFWAGHYGAKISGSVVKVLLPIKLKCAE